MFEYVLFVIGVVLLVKGADYLIQGSASLGKKWGISQLIIGLTIVAFGTSAPELFINTIAAINGKSDIAIGNIVGSNISNILLVMGIMLLIMSVKVKKDAVRNEIPYSLFAVLMLLIFALISGTLTRVAGIVLIVLFGFFLWHLHRMATVSHRHVKKANKEKHIFLVWANIIGGILGLYIGGQLVVDNAITIATRLGVSEYMIALTIIAVGTSLPELVTAVMAGIKKQADIGIGNIVGSNIFNIFWVLGVTAIIRPVVFPGFAISDIAVLLGITALLLIFALNKKKVLTWKHGVVFLLLYAIYIAFIIIR